ncbi:MAG: NUDIX hydrolase [Desulfotomaculales bacterium]
MLPDGREATREVVEHAGAVAVVALDKEGNVYLVRQYRYPVQSELLEIPAGILKPGEAPLAGAQRELAEETGITAASWCFLFSLYSSPGFSDELLSIFLARDLQFAAQQPDEDEFIKVAKVPLREVPGMIAKGAIRDAKSIAGLLAALTQDSFCWRS